MVGVLACIYLLARQVNRNYQTALLIHCVHMHALEAATQAVQNGADPNAQVDLPVDPNGEEEHGFSLLTAIRALWVKPVKPEYSEPVIVAVCEMHKIADQEGVPPVQDLKFESDKLRLIKALFVHGCKHDAVMINSLLDEPPAVLQEYLDLGGSLNVFDRYAPLIGADADHLDILVAHGANINEKISGDTLLKWKLNNGCWDLPTVKKLVELGLDMQAQNSDGTTAITDLDQLIHNLKVRDKDITELQQLRAYLTSELKKRTGSASLVSRVRNQAANRKSPNADTGHR